MTSPFLTDPDSGFKLVKDDGLDVDNIGQINYNDGLKRTVSAQRESDIESLTLRSGVGLYRDNSINEENKSKTYFIKSVFMLCSISLGVGVFVLPGLLNVTGVMVGVIMLIGFAIMSAYTQCLVLKCCKQKNMIKYNIESYEQLSSHTFSVFGEFFLELFILLTLLIANCSHIQTVGQILNKLIEWFYDAPEKDNLSKIKTFILYSSMLMMALPWLFQKHLHGLSGVGTSSVFCVCVTSFSLIIFCLYKISNEEYAKNGDEPIIGFTRLGEVSFWKTDFWLTAPAFAFVYSGIFELFPVYKELLHCDVKMAQRSIIYSTIICCLIYVFVGVVIVITFGSNIEDNALDNISNSNYWFQLCKFALIIVIVLLYPVINYPLVNAAEKILELLFQNICRFKENIEKSNKLKNLNVFDYQYDYLMKTELIQIYGKYYGNILHYRRDLISIFLVLVVIAIDIFVKDLPDLFGLTGSLGMAFCCYIFPSLLYIKIYWNNMSILTLIINIFIILFAATIMVYSTTVIIISIV